MSTTHRLKPKTGTALVAVFEIVDEASVLVSAALGICTYRYKDTLTTAEAREYWQELVTKGWTLAANDTSSHEDVWNIYV